MLRLGEFCRREIRQDRPNEWLKNSGATIRLSSPAVGPYPKMRTIKAFLNKPSRQPSQYIRAGPEWHFGENKDDEIPNPRSNRKLSRWRGLGRGSAVAI
jgi:hypothetical protein